MHCTYVIGILFFTLNVTVFSINIFGHHKLKLDTNKLDTSKLIEKWIEQPLNHFDPHENRTFKVRYFENAVHWRPNGAVYVFLGGECDEYGVWIASNDTIVSQLAKETNGIMFSIEHRYYGSSEPKIPRQDQIQYFKYLSSHQALADIANLIKMLKSDPDFKNSPVVVIGGSYAGNLTAWMRVLYPDIVDAALADSAPVLAKKDFHEYFDITSDTFAKYGTENCLPNIEKTFKRYEHLLKSNAGIETLKKELNVCPDHDLSLFENKQCLFLELYANIGQTAQYGSVSSIREVCDKFGSNNSFKIDPHALDDSFTCLKFKDCWTTWTTSSLQIPTEWRYQFCTEFGYLATTSSEKQPFLHWLPLEFWMKSCIGLVEGDIEKMIDEGVAKSNALYGGLNPKVSKVVFVHGEMDPWRALGIQHDLGSEAPAIIVNASAHCCMLVSPDDAPAEAKETKKYVKELIKKWISDK